MDKKQVLIIVAILVIVVLGFIFVTSMTGNVITGMVASGAVVENELFRIDDFGSGEEVNEEEDLNDTQNSSGSR